MLNFHFKKDFRLVTGKSETGKTTLWLQLLFAKGWKFVFVFDPQREVAMKQGLPAATSLREMVAHAASTRVVCYDSSVMYPGDPEEGFAFFCRWVMTVAQKVKGPIHVGIDEIWRVTQTGRGGIPTAFMELMNEGRRFEIRGYFIAQGVNEVHDAVRKQLVQIFTFQHSDPLCLKWLADRGFDPQAVQTLPPKGVYLCRNMDTCTTTKGGKFNGTQPKTKADR